ncbi:Dad2p [Sugiyamaella lignohabitans]|uniref:DASH complex subunit DAD2 n=1 Tax=Sugiyamaella lignohabitans TaxID=796027 RepID=A0A161HKB9_9ASCO|nr:Dad2p [Sugiyamaella lignohabitans]ANB13397.1 Dad2p [Sugiyamaella lignohabitans]
MSSSLSARLSEKKKEVVYLQQLQNTSKALVTELEELAKKFNTLTAGTESVAELMSNWANILHALKLASSSLQKYAEKDYDSEVDPPLPETLVRIRLDQP